MSSLATRPIDLLLVGNSRVQAIENGLCTGCNSSVDQTDFSDIERKEYNITGWCKSCQDGFFRSPKQEPRPSAVTESPTRKPHKIYIQVSFSQKEDAKKLKARWNPSLRCWFTWSNNPNNSALFERFSKRDESTLLSKPYVPKKKPVYVPEGYILFQGRLRKQRFFDLNGDEI